MTGFTCPVKGILLSFVIKANETILFESGNKFREIEICN